jgi:hypothetical protein
MLTLASVSLVTTIFMPLRNGMGTQQLKLRPSGLENSAFWNVTIRPSAWPKKSPMGTLTAGALAPSQNISRRRPRSILGVRSGMVIQIRRTVPLVRLASARTRVSPGCRSRRQGARLRPSSPRQAPPFSPLGFSAVAQRGWTPG